MVLKCESSEIQGAPVIKVPTVCSCTCVGWNFWGKNWVQVFWIVEGHIHRPQIFLRKWSESHICHFLPLLFLIQALAHKNCVHCNLVLITPYLHHFLRADFPCVVAVCCQWHLAVQIDKRQQWPLVPLYVQGHFSERCVSCHCCQFKMWFMVAVTNIFWDRFIIVMYHV